MKTPQAPLLAPYAEDRCEVLWLAGEHSGDQHAALASAELSALRPEWRQAALGGPVLASVGVPLLHDLTESSVVGLVEVLRHYSFFKRLFAETEEWIRAHGVKVLVLVDYPGFNLRLAQALHDAGLTRKSGGDLAIYYYISPQVWAWKGKRRFAMAKILDELGVIFPFEVATFADTTLPVRFVGHPFLAPGHAPPVAYDPEGSVLLLPGSRLQPVRRIFPPLLQGVREARSSGSLDRTVPIVSLAASAGLEVVQRRLAGLHGVEIDVFPVGTPLRARAVLTSSGTMSLACALAGIPGAIVYRAHPLTYWIGRRLVKIPYLGIANLILERAAYPEYLQGESGPRRLAAALESAMTPERAQAAAEDAAALRKALTADDTDAIAERIIAVAEG